MPRRVLLAFALLVILGACSEPYRGVTSGARVAPLGAGEGLSNMDACVQSCESTHARCMDAGSARRDPDSVAATIYGTRFDCDAGLQSCLPRCRGR